MFPHVSADLTLLPWTDSPVDPSDTLLATYLIATWAKICQALGPEFEPFLPVVMPPLLNAASAKADVSIYGKHACTRVTDQRALIPFSHVIDDEEDHCERDGWETISMDGQIVGIRTSAIDEKCQAFDTLVIYCSILGGRFGPYLTQSLELTLPALQFYFHEGVREAACRYAPASLVAVLVSDADPVFTFVRLIPLLTSCGKSSGTLTPSMVTASLSKLVYCIQIESDPSFVASLYKAVGDTLRVVGVHALTPELTSGLMDGTKLQLQNMAEKRKRRSGARGGTGGSGIGGAGTGTGVPGLGGSGGGASSDQHPQQDEDDREEIALVEEMEEFALEDMDKTLRVLDGQHPLLIAVASVRELGSQRYPWEGDEELGRPGDVEG